MLRMYSYKMVEKTTFEKFKEKQREQLQKRLKDLAKFSKQKLVKPQKVKLIKVTASTPKPLPLLPPEKKSGFFNFKNPIGSKEQKSIIITKFFSSNSSSQNNLKGGKNVFI